MLSSANFEDANRASRCCGLFFAFCSGMLYDVKVRMHNNIADTIQHVPGEAIQQKIQKIQGEGESKTENNVNSQVKEWNGSIPSPQASPTFSALPAGSTIPVITEP